MKVAERWSEALIKKFFFSSKKQDLHINVFFAAAICAMRNNRTTIQQDDSHNPTTMEIPRLRCNWAKASRIVDDR